MPRLSPPANSQADGGGLPEVPLTVTVHVPWLELLLAANLHGLLDVAGLWLKGSPTPLGRPEVPRVTWPVKLPDGTIVIVLVLVERGFMNRGGAERLKFAGPAGFTLSETLVECTVVRLVPAHR